MRQKKMIIYHDDLQKIADGAVRLMGKDYLNTSDSMIVLGCETYRFRNNSTQWDMVVLKKIEGETHIDIVGTAGGSGLFNISWWSESGFTKSMFRHLVNQCDNNGWSYKEIQ